MLLDYSYILILGIVGLCFSLLGLAISGPRIFGRVAARVTGQETVNDLVTTAVGDGQSYALTKEDRNTGDGDAFQPFESGAPTDNKTWVQFRLRYAVLSLVFISFDMEMVYMFPWGVVFKKLGFVAFGDMFVFVAILAVAIAFAWKEGAFDWED